MKHTLLCFSFFVSSLASMAQVSMVADINTGIPGSSPSKLTSFNEYLMFFANDGVNGNELWALTDTGTQLIFNINPGSPGSGNSANYTSMAVADGKLYFAADDGTTGQELYSWDGDMDHPPVLIEDVNTSSIISQINEIVSYNNKVYFGAYSQITGYELWVHNPSNNSTMAVSAIGNGTISSSPQNIIAYQGKVYFSAFNSTTGRELYVYNPMTNNTSLAIDIYSGSQSSDPQSIVIIDSVLYFSASTSAYGRELYTYDGMNYQRLSDLNNGSANSILNSLPGQNRIGGLNGRVYFCGDDGATGAQLYQHNSNNGTQTLTYNINPTSTSFPSSFINYGDNMFFAAYDDTHGIELWKYSTDSIPEMVADIDTVGSSNPMNMVVHKNILYFAASTQNSGIELFQYVDSGVVTGIKNVRFDGSVKVYPNPANTNVNIELSLQKAEKINIVVADITGKIVYNSGLIPFTAGTTTTNIPMNNTASGMYFYKITGNTGTMYFSGRLIKQ